MKIQAAVLTEAHQPFAIETVELAPIQADEVLVRMIAVGICHTDIAVQERSMPLPLPAVVGHEGAGVVEQVGAQVTAVQVGDHVLISMAYCGACTNCSRKHVMYCDHLLKHNYIGRRLDGTSTHQLNGQPITGNFFGQSSFATHAVARARAVVKVDNALPLACLTPLSCGIQTGMGTVLRSLQAQPGSSMVIYGAGTVGMSAVVAAALRQCRPLVVVEPLTERRALARELGATHVLDPSRTNLPSKLRELAPRGMDYAVDTTGVLSVLHGAMGALANRGTLALLGVPNDPAATIQLPLLHAISKGITVKAILEGDSYPPEFIPELVGLYKAGKLPLERFIRTYAFEQINEAIHDQLRGKVLKPVLVF